MSPDQRRALCLLWKQQRWDQASSPWCLCWSVSKREHKMQRLAKPTAFDVLHSTVSIVCVCVCACCVFVFVCAGHRTNTTSKQTSTNRACGAFSKVSESSASSQNTVECAIAKCWTKRRTTKWFIRNQRCTIGPGKNAVGCDFKATDLKRLFIQKWKFCHHLRVNGVWCCRDSSVL